MGCWDPTGHSKQTKGPVESGVASKFVVRPVIGLNNSKVWIQRCPICCSSKTSLSLPKINYATRPISKEEKEKENNKKSSPTKASQVHFVDDNKMCDNVTNRLYSVRHHLERTTGPGSWCKPITLRWLTPYYSFIFKTLRRVPYCHRLRAKNLCPPRRKMTRAITHSVAVPKRVLHRDTVVLKREAHKRVRKRLQSKWQKVG